jgi:hypothetical protein
VPGNGPRVGTIWLALTLPLFCLSAVLLTRTIRGLVGATRDAVILDLPVVRTQEITLPEGGRLQLSVETRRGSTGFRSLDYRLVAATGEAVALQPVPVPTTVSSIARVRVPVRTFVSPGPGRLTLEVTGGGAFPDDDRLMITRPIGGPVVVHVLSLVVLAAVTIGSLVASVLVVMLPARVGSP